MKTIPALILTVISLPSFAQRSPDKYSGSAGRIYETRYVQQPPVYPMGIDSCRRYYFSHFGGMDSIVLKVVAHGDTAKYLRVYFSFVVDKYGFLSAPHFTRTASTRYAKSVTAKTITYIGNEVYYDKLIKEMLRKMAPWKPALKDGVPVSCRVEDYFQFRLAQNTTGY